MCLGLARGLGDFLALVKLASTASPGIEDEATISARHEEARKLRHEFELWRDAVARPVFSGFVLKLEAAGHRARVIVRTGTVESVEIRARVLRSHYNPSGYVRISFQQYGNNWGTDMEPKAERNRGYSGHSATEVPKANAQTTRQELEAMVMEMLNRLNK